VDGLDSRLGTDRDGAYAAATSAVPLRRACTPEEVAGVVAWLSSPAASYVIGAVVNVDGSSTVVDVASRAFTTLERNREDR
jgi:meso-butanediol dehydrogenase/(S,S)-butanediol dehydrogenase/diacetyl reductase